MEILLPQRYESLKGLISEQELVKIQQSRVALIGLGAGSNTLPLLAREGVATRSPGILILADPDTVEEVNLVRTPYLSTHVSKNKAEAASQIALSIDNRVNIQVEVNGATTENIDRICGNSDVVQEMVDIANPSAVLLVHDSARKNYVPVVTGMDLGLGTLTYVFRYDQENAYGLRDLLGFPDNLAPEDLHDFNPLAIAAQIIIGPLDKKFSEPSHARDFYSESFFNENNLGKLFSSVPQEMVNIINNILNGQLQRVPQSGIAGTQLGVIHAEIVNGLILNYPLISAPNKINLNITNLINSPNGLS